MLGAMHLAAKGAPGAEIAWLRAHGNVHDAVAMTASEGVDFLGTAIQSNNDCITLGIAHYCSWKNSVAAAVLA